MLLRVVCRGQCELVFEVILVHNVKRVCFLSVCISFLLHFSHSTISLQLASYNLWNKINSLTLSDLNGCRWVNLPLNLEKYLFINNSQKHSSMSIQLTGNTCYFQTYLFTLLCKVGKPKISSDGRSIELLNVGLLEQATVSIAQFLLTFFIDNDNKILRPLTNNNFILDFHRYADSPYYNSFVGYLKKKNIDVPSYDAQYKNLLAYYIFNKSLHGYDKFSLEGATSSTPNTKSLQYVQGTEGASQKLARGDYYKYRAANLMFGCNAGAMYGISNFSQFNSWRKNQLLSFYEALHGNIHGISDRIEREGLTKYRDYCKDMERLSTLQRVIRCCIPVSHNLCVFLTSVAS